MLYISSFVCANKCLEIETQHCPPSFILFNFIIIIINISPQVNYHHTTYNTLTSRYL